MKWNVRKKRSDSKEDAEVAINQYKKEKVLEEGDC